MNPTSDQLEVRLLTLDERHEPAVGRDAGLVEALRRSEPDIPALFVSGYAPEEVVGLRTAGDVEADDVGSVQQLAETVREVLAAK